MIVGGVADIGADFGHARGKAALNLGQGVGRQFARLGLFGQSFQGAQALIHAEQLGIVW